MLIPWIYFAKVAGWGILISIAITILSLFSKESEQGAGLVFIFLMVLFAIELTMLAINLITF